MKEITSKKTGKVKLITDESWDNLVTIGWSSRFRMREVEPIKNLIPTPRIIKAVEKVEIKKTPKKKVDE
jgi:hypothetical protein